MQIFKSDSHNHQTYFIQDRKPESSFLKPCFEQRRNGLLFLLSQCSTILEKIEAVPEIFIPEDCMLLKEGRFHAIHSYLNKLQHRIVDKTSKILVTGDLNAGKSTFCNTLLRRQIVPDDQEPCTATFVEIIDAQENSNIEEVHAISDVASYRKDDNDTFTAIPLDKLRGVVEKGDSACSLLKVYCKDGGQRSNSGSNLGTPLLRNGIVDVCLIDSPGLNIDSVKTTALFSKQEEIDVVVFVVNAENHFTLSGKQFLETATREKAFVFIIVNRFDTIEKKQRNQEEILNQIRAISPQTFGSFLLIIGDFQQLVHFISAKSAFSYFMNPKGPKSTWVTDFERMESCLKNFIMHRRSLSKLSPARKYLENVFSDCDHIVQSNLLKIDHLISVHSDEFGTTFERMSCLKKFKEVHFGCAPHILDEIDEGIGRQYDATIASFLEEYELFMDSIEWNGLYNISSYSDHLRDVVFKLAAVRVSKVQDFADAYRKERIQCMRESVVNDLSEIGLNIHFAEIHEEMDDIAFSVPTHQELLYSSEKYHLLTSAFPGIFITSFSVYGFRTFSSMAFRPQSASMAKVGRMIFAGLALAGMSMLCFTLSDMKRVIKAQLSARFKRFFEGSCFFQDFKKKILKISRKNLHSGIYDIQKEFQLIYNDTEIACDSAKMALVELKRRKDILNGLETNMKGLKLQIESISIK